MGIITWDDVKRGTLAVVLVILPTVLLGTYLSPALQSYQITGPGLWNLKRAEVPDTVIEPLHELRLNPFFFKSALIREVEKRIADKTLFEKYEKQIERQISAVPLPGIEYIFLATLAAFYGILWFGAHRWFPDGQDLNASNVCHSSSESNGNSS